MEGGGTDRCLRSGQREVRGAKNRLLLSQYPILLTRIEGFLLLLNKCIASKKIRLRAVLFYRHGVRKCARKFAHEHVTH